jgi:hypothetical protein
VSYNVYKDHGCTGTFAVLNTAPVTVLTFTDTGMADGECNAYRVTSVNAGGESDPTGSVQLTTPTFTAAKQRLAPPPSFMGVAN